MAKVLTMKKAQEKTETIMQKLNKLRHERKLVQQKMREHERELDQAVGTGAADSIATKVILENTKLQALNRTIAQLELRALPAAECAESEASRQASLASARKLHARRVEMAKEIVALGSQLDQLWQMFRETEQTYNEVICDAGLEPRAVSQTAAASMVTGVVPAMIDEIAGCYSVRLVRGDDPVRMLERHDPDQLRSTRQED